MNVPNVKVDDSALTNGEPLVEDFQARYGSSTLRPRANVVNQASNVLSAPDDTLTGPAFALSLDDDSDEAPPPPDFSGRQVQFSRQSRSVLSNIQQSSELMIDSHISARTATPQQRPKEQHIRAPSSSLPTTPISHDRSSMESTHSADTVASSINILPPLQAKGLDESDRLEPLLEDDPASFDLVAAPAAEISGMYQLEKRAEILLSSAHLEMIFSDPKSLVKFTTFLNIYRASSIPILIFYLDALKALRAITYANAISEALEPIKGFEFTEQAPLPTQNIALQQKAEQAFEVLVREDLPAYIVHVWIQVVSVSIQRRITGTLAPHLREASEGLAEVFCLSDPSRQDNPIVFASEGKFEHDTGLRTAANNV